MALHLRSLLYEEKANMLLCSVGGQMARETFGRVSSNPRASHLGARTNMTTRFMHATLFLSLAVFAAIGFAQSKPATPRSLPNHSRRWHGWSGGPGSPMSKIRPTAR